MMCTSSSRSTLSQQQYIISATVVIFGFVIIFGFLASDTAFQALCTIQTYFKNVSHISRVEPGRPTVYLKLNFLDGFSRHIFGFNMIMPACFSFSVLVLWHDPLDPYSCTY